MHASLLQKKSTGQRSFLIRVTVNSPRAQSCLSRFESALSLSFGVRRLAMVNKESRVVPIAR